MTGHPFLGIDRPAGLDLGQVIREHARQLVVVARAEVVLGPEAFFETHTAPSKAALSCSIARAHSIRIAPDDRPI